MLRQEPSIKQQHLVPYVHAPAQPFGTQAHEVEQVLGETIGLLVSPGRRLVDNRQAVLLPGTVKQRDHAMVEDVKKIAQGPISAAPSFQE